MTINYKFRVDASGKFLFYQGSVVCEDELFITVNDRYKGLIRISKSKIISQEKVQE